MPSTHPQRRSRGFTLIELLVVMAIIGVLIVNLVPPLLGLRESVAQNVGTQSLNTPLCSPPWCDSLGAGTTLRYPSISPDLAAGDVLAHGLGVRFDLHQAGAASQFAISPGTAGGAGGAFDVLFGIDPGLLIGDAFSLNEVRYTDAGTVHFEVESLSTGTALALEAGASGSTITVGAVPEPAGWTLIVLGLALAAITGCGRRTRRSVLVLAGLAALGTAQAAVTTFTSRAAFDAAVSAQHDMQAVIENFDTTAAGTAIADGSTLHGIRYTYGNSGNHLAGGAVGIEVSAGYGTTSAPNYLGTSDTGVFQSGDDFSFSFASAQAVGLYFIVSNDALVDGDITLRVAGTQVALQAADEQPFGLADGRVYFLGLLDPAHTFSAASVASACCGLFLFNIDDIVLAHSTPVPEPSTQAFALLGLAALASRKRRRTLIAATTLLAAVGAHAQRTSLGDLQNQIAASVTCPAALPGQARFVDKGDGTVCDAATGLMWEKKVDCSGAPNLENPHCLANTYTWSASAGGTDRSGTLYTDFLARLNDLVNLNDGYGTPCFAGHCDWRVPTIGELRSLVTTPYPVCTSGLCIDPVFGIPAQVLVFWSSSRDARVGYYAWTVRFDLGFVTSYDNRVGGRNAMAVRGGR